MSFDAKVRDNDGVAVIELHGEVDAAADEPINSAYERAVSRDDLTPQLREVLQRNLADERRHRAWIEARLASM